MKAKKAGDKPRATNTTREARIEAIVRIKLDGAEPWDVRQFVAVSEKAGESPWTMGRGKKPLSDRQIRRYCALADERIAECVRTLNPEAFHLHLAKRHRLYAKAVQAGDLRTALAVLSDLAKLHGFYPPKGIKLSGDVRTINDDLAEMTEEELQKETERLDRLRFGTEEGKSEHGNGAAGG